MKPASPHGFEGSDRIVMPERYTLRERVLTNGTRHGFWVAVVLWSCVLPAGAGDRTPSPFHAWPLLRPSPAVAELQTEPHTCGFHTLSTIYKAHGLNPANWRLRERLGTDVPVFSLQKSSTGTVQADMVRVLVQDHFNVEAVEPGVPDARQRMLRHFQEGYLAAVLIRRRENQHLHWIVLNGFDLEKNILHVVDSIPRAQEHHYYEEPYQDFMDNVALQVLLIRPEQRGIHDRSLLALHAEGWSMMARSFGLLIPSFVLLAATSTSASIWVLGFFLIPHTKRPFRFWRHWLSAMVGVFSGLITLAVTAYVIDGGFIAAWVVACIGCALSLKQVCGYSWLRAFAAPLGAILILLLYVTVLMLVVGVFYSFD